MIRVKLEAVYLDYWEETLEEALVHFVPHSQIREVSRHVTAKGLPVVTAEVECHGDEYLDVHAVLEEHDIDCRAQEYFDLFAGDGGTPVWVEVQS